MDRISLSVGSGGKAMRDFIRGEIIKHLGNSHLERLGDSAHLELDGRIGFTTDSFVIKPLFFPGGDIGKLAVVGTVNDLVVAGVEPAYISLSLIIEEGFSVSDLERILNSIKMTADRAGVEVVTGDTKVVRKGEADGLYINTAGVGRVVGEPGRLQPGDVIIVTGSIGDHSVAVMVARGEFEFEGEVMSDCQPLHELLPLWEMGVKWMRDITRGGLATVLSEIAEGEEVPVYLEETKVPVSAPVAAVSEILGIDPLYLASEGKAVLAVPTGKAAEILSFLKSRDAARQAAQIGEIGGMGRAGETVLKTVSGGFRLLEPLTGELLPRIC